MNTIILTHTGKLGDMLYSLMIGSWLWKNYNRKIHWVLPRSFGPFRFIENLLMLQSQTEKVTLVDHKIENFSCGGQPYKFDPMIYGIEGEYFNLGFRGYPDQFIPAFYAKEYGLGIDPDFVLKISDSGTIGDGKPIPEGIHPLTNTSGAVWFVGAPNHQRVLRSSELAMQMLMPDVEPLPTSIDLLELVRLVAGAKEFHSWYCGIAVLCWLANLPAHVYRVRGHADTRMYFPFTRKLIIHELEVHPKDMVKP
jgi:hypothetical protein